jgi:hypothetical protein
MGGMPYAIEIESQLVTQKMYFITRVQSTNPSARIRRICLSRLDLNSWQCTFQFVVYYIARVTLWHFRNTKNSMKRATKREIKTNPSAGKTEYRARQPSLFESRHLANSESTARLKKEWRKLSRRTHGGVGSLGHRKESRPLDKKLWTHLILKSEKACGAFGFLRPKNQLFIAKLFEKKALKFHVTIQSFANVGNHLHVKLKFANRDDFQNFLRSITSLIARFVTGARKGKPFGKFWDGLAYTRVVTTKKEELLLRGYLKANRIEAILSKSQRELFLLKFNSWVRKLDRNGGP